MVMESNKLFLFSLSPSQEIVLSIQWWDEGRQVQTQYHLNRKEEKKKKNHNYSYIPLLGGIIFLFIVFLLVEVKTFLSLLRMMGVSTVFQTIFDECTASIF